MSKPVFKLPIAADGKGFAPLELQARILEGSAPGSGSPAPIRWVAGMSEPQNLLLIETPGFAEDSTSATVRITVNPQVTAIPAEPVSVRLRMGPSQASDGTRFEGGEVVSDLAVKISDLLIEWEADPATCRQGDSLVLPLVRNKEVILKLKARRIAAGPGGADDDETISFTHTLGPAGFSRQVFDEVADKATQRRELTTWRCSGDMAAAAAAGLTLPVDCKIEIEARIGTDTQPKDTLSIPVSLAEPKTVMKLIDPPLPIPADGTAIAVALQVNWQMEGEASATPASDLELQIEKKNPADGIDSTLKFSGPAKTDQEGILRFDYTPPELFYQPGGKFEDIYVAYLGSGAARKSLGEIKIPLAPSIRFTISALKEAEIDQQKFGIEFPEEEISILAEQRVRSVKGVLALVEETPGGKKNIPVSQAEITLAFFDGKQFVPQSETTKKLLTNIKGEFTLNTPELTSIMPAGTGVDYLIPEADVPVGALTTAAEGEMKEYERVLDQVEDFTKCLEPPVAEKVNGYRPVFVTHLANLATTDFSLVQASARLFGKIVGYAGLFFRNYRSRWDRIWDKIKGAISTIIDFAWEYLKCSEKIVEALAPVAKSLMASGGRLLDAAFKRGGRLMIGIARAMRPMIAKAKSLAGDLFEGAMHYVGIAEQHFNELLDGLEEKLVDVSAFVSYLGAAALHIACLIGSAFMAMFSALAGVVKTVLANLGIGGDAAGSGEVFSRFATEFLAAIGVRYEKPWGQTMEKLVETVGGEIIDESWKVIDSALKGVKTSATNALGHIDPGGRAYGVPIAQASKLASASPPKVPDDWEERIETLKNLRREQYSADQDWDVFAAKVDYIRDVLSIAVDLGKTLAMLVTAVFATALTPTVAIAADRITVGFKAIAGLLIDVPRLAAGLWALKTEYVDTPARLYAASAVGSSS